MSDLLFLKRIIFTLGRWKRISSMRNEVFGFDTWLTDPRDSMVCLIYAKGLLGCLSGNHRGEAASVNNICYWSVQWCVCRRENVWNRDTTNTNNLCVWKNGHTKKVEHRSGSCVKHNQSASPIDLCKSQSSNGRNLIGDFICSRWTSTIKREAVHACAWTDTASNILEYTLYTIPNPLTESFTFRPHCICSICSKLQSERAH